ncbi:MAG: serine/threonine-protein kinase [Tahibacter sp.]
MQADRWVRLEQLFADALALEPAEREAFLQRHCADDAALRDEVAELLRSHDASGVLDSAPHSTPDSTEVAAPLPSLSAGACLGAWRIEHLIGRGGMGEVYMAARIDAAFEQRVALKVLRHEAVGQLQRFHDERRILARMEHPGIARLLDGGIAPDGRPYTVMEFVEGVSLTEYCRERHASLGERLALFAQVCDAVAFAHRNLVIHRDLKPDNILVDAQGRVKLLDFGIAKLLDATATAAEADITIAPFTPDYAAPEQLSGQHITTATDIYALGALLFELLSGERPFRMRGLPSSQVLKLVLDRDAPIPSRVAQGNANAPIPPRQLRGDLDAIVAKCLRKDPLHRYETVNALLRDVRSHTRHEPVSARDGARLYTYARFIRRNKWAVSGVAALFVSLAAGLAGTLWQARRAETQARTAMAVQGFLGDIFRANTSSQDDPLKARLTTARELLDLGAKKIDTAMVDAPAAKLTVLTLLGELYDDLSLDNEAVRLRQQRVELARKLYGSDSIESAEALLELAGSMYYASNATQEREKILLDASAILDRRGDHSSATRASLLIKQTEHYYSVDAPRALADAREAVRLFEAMPASAALGEALYARALSEHNNGSVREAVASLQRAIDISRAADGYPNPSLPRYYAYLGQYQYRMQDIAHAEESARLAFQLAIAMNGERHTDTLQAQMRLGRQLFDSGHTQEGLALLQSAQKHAIESRGADDPVHTPLLVMEWGAEQVRYGLLEDGLASLDSAIANRRRLRPGSTYLATALEVAASDLLELGRVDDARRNLDEASAIKLKAGVAPRSARFNFNTGVRIRLALIDNQPETARSLLDELAVDADESLGISFTAIEQSLARADVELASGHAEVAAQLAGQVRDKMDKSHLSTFLPFYVIRADLIQGQAALLAQRPADALPVLQRTLDMRVALLAPTSPRIAEAQIALARCQSALGENEKADALAKAAADILATHPRVGSQYREPLRLWQAAREFSAKAKK